MRISKTAPLFIACLLTLGAIFVGGHALAFDVTKKFKPDEEPRTILRFGYNALKRGAIDEAVSAFRLGAERNDLASQWKLARMLQTGDGVDQDHQAAYDLYSTIVERFADQYPTGGDRVFVANAMVALGHYDLQGVRDTDIDADPRRAEYHFYRAAAIFHDAEAQYQLGQLYRHGTLGSKQSRQAARWMLLSYKKGHLGARAAIGEMMFYGEGLRRDPVRGLVLLGQAAASADPIALAWVHDSYAKAMDDANPPHREAAKSILDQMANAGPQDGVIRAPANVSE